MKRKKKKIADGEIRFMGDVQMKGKNKNKGKLQIPPELSSIYRKPPDTKKLSNTPLNFQILSLMTLLVVNCPNYHSLQNYAVLGLPKTTSFYPKRRSFGYFRF
jgi:hypothetical protein